MASRSTISHLDNNENNESSLSELYPETPATTNLFVDREYDIFENDNSNDSERTIVYNHDMATAAQQESHDEDSSQILVLSSNVDSEEPPTKVRRLSVLNSSKGEDTEWDVCTICFETWSNSGAHRLVSLKCGHLFGHSCVERWLKAQPPKQRTCPTCKSKAAVRDIRCIYAKHLVAADTSEITALQMRIQELEKEKRDSEQQMLSTKMSLINLKSKISELERLLSLQGAKSTRKKYYKFSLAMNKTLCKDGSCRVMTYNPRSYNLCISLKSSNNLFPGYGIRNVSFVDQKFESFIHLHPKAIRDIKFSPATGCMMSVGLDGSARMTERGIATTVIQTTTPLWACSWDNLRENELYVAGGNGNIFHYDIRNTSNYIQSLSVPHDRSPVVSLHSTRFGLLSCSLQRSWLWVPNSIGQLEPRALPLSGPFMSMAYDAESDHVAVSGKPTSERGKVWMCRLSGEMEDVHCDIVQTFNGSIKGSVMSRCEWVKAEGSKWIAAHSESEEALVLHGVDGAQTVSLKSSEPALDVCSFQYEDNTFVAALSGSNIRIYGAL